MRGKFVSGERRKMAIKGWPEGGKAVAMDGLSRAEIGLICLMIVSKPATKNLSRSRGLEGELGMGRGSAWAGA